MEMIQVIWNRTLYLKEEAKQQVPNMREMELAFFIILTAVVHLRSNIKVDVIC